MKSRKIYAILYVSERIKGCGEMYQAGQQVVYGAHGVCTIMGTEARHVDKKTIEYYVLQPLQQPDSRFYVPAHNESALAKMRPLMEKKALLALLQSEDIRNNEWIPDENRRKQYYRQLITSLDLEAMIRMIHVLRRHRKEMAEAGRKFHLCDDNFLRDAQRLLRSELQLVLEIPEKELDGYLINLIGE